LISATGDCGKAQAVAMAECADPCCVARLRGEPTEEVCKYETCENAAEEIGARWYASTYIPEEYWQQAGSDPEKYYGWGGYSEEQRRVWCVSFYNGRYEARRPGYKRDTDQYHSVLRMNTPVGSPA